MLQKQALELSSRKFKTNVKWNGDSSGYSTKATTEKNHTCRPVVSNSHKPIDNNLVEPKKISTQEIQRRRNSGLCFKCGKKYGVGHQCSLKNFSLIILDEEEESDPLGSMGTQDEGEEDTSAFLDVCLNALTNKEHCKAQ